ncbi:mannitol 1-phosphate dehydrogenase [Histoplasma capsulatum]|uniref:Mannitol 1-phosphate dehydrogenase n=1 Tax=Ajellomyces capsulatus TaxID=5037 RepID=A0A8A1M4Y8_AJECA|nr:mannitol 1-phosphate dehydrogenase [Histoplasma capsulatum]
MSMSMSMSSTPDPSFTIAIICAGIAGLALAIGLRKQNAACKYTIYEAAPQFHAVGAGIGMGPNALRAMELMDAGFAEMYVRPDQGVWGGSVSHWDFERSSAHRQALLEVMSALVPDGTVQFNRWVMRVEHVEGQTRGVTRRVVLEMEYPEEIVAKYCHPYFYRNIVPMQEAKLILGSYADNAKWFMGEGRRCVMYAISKGEEVNVVVFIRDERPWVGEQAAMRVSREDMLSDFNGFDKRLLDHTKPLRWPLFHHPDILTYYRGHVCVLGDSAHASSPSQAAGAGLGLEDALVMSGLLGLVKKPEQLESASEVYNSIRQPRAQAVVQGSQEALLAYFLVHPEFGHDIQKLTDYANTRLPLIRFHDLEGDVKTAGQRFRELTEAAQPDNREQ